MWKTTDDTAPLGEGEEAASIVLSSPFPRRDFLALRLKTKEVSIGQALRSSDITYVARSVFAYTRIRRVKLKSGYSNHSEFAYAFPTQKSTARNEKEVGQSRVLGSSY